MVSRRFRRDRRAQLVVGGAGALVGTLVGTSQPASPGAAHALLVVAVVAALVVVWTLSWMVETARRARPRLPKLLRMK